MNKVLLSILIITSSTLIYGQDQETRSVDAFKSVRVGQAIDLYLKKGSSESVKVEVDGIDIEEVITEVKGGTLKVFLDRNNYRGRSDVEVYVTYVDLEEISVSSAASVYSSEIIISDEFRASTSSAGYIEVKVESKYVELSASSSGDIEISGKTDKLDVSASSAAEIDAYDLDAKEVNASASSAGSIKLSVSESLEAEASSTGSIRYKGNPSKSHTDSSSMGSVKKSFD